MMVIVLIGDIITIDMIVTIVIVVIRIEPW